MVNGPSRFLLTFAEIALHQSPIYLLPYEIRTPPPGASPDTTKSSPSHCHPTHSSSADSADSLGQAYLCPGPTYSPAFTAFSSFPNFRSPPWPLAIQFCVSSRFGSLSSLAAVGAPSTLFEGLTFGSEVALGWSASFVSERGHGCYRCCQERQVRIEIGQSIETWATCETHLDHVCRSVIQTCRCDCGIFVGAIERHGILLSDIKRSYPLHKSLRSLCSSAHYSCNVKSEVVGLLARS